MLKSSLLINSVYILLITGYIQWFLTIKADLIKVLTN